MSLDIEEQLHVNAPVDRVWKFLIDPERIVTCLPGAELTKIEDARTFLGNMKVKVGPVTVSYQGRIKMTEVDDDAHLVRMSGEGTEKGGAGSARMTMESRVVEKDGGSQITVVSKVDLAGKIVQFGRGMVKGVAQQMFKQFSTNLRGALETAEAAREPEPPPAAVAVVAPDSEPPAAVVPTATEAETVTTADERTAAAVSEEKITRPVAVIDRPVTRPLAVPAKREVEPVRIVPIILKVLFGPIIRFFKRLFGRT